MTAKNLRRGWTTGICAAAAAKAAWGALCGGSFQDPVAVSLPRRGRSGNKHPGQYGDIERGKVSFPLSQRQVGNDWAKAAVIKDAGDDPDVTHGVAVVVTVRRLAPGSGVVFRAGDGVGIVSRPGLPVAVGEAAINPGPRQMIREGLADVSRQWAVPCDVAVEISIPGGERLAEKTWNPRLGVRGGLSILGTTGIVEPYSCSAWIHAIRSGISVALAAGRRHLIGATGRTSEGMARRLYPLDEDAFIDMGDFAGAMLKYVRGKDIDRITIVGGFAKICKLAQGAKDLHSGRSQVDFSFLSQRLERLGGDRKMCREVSREVSALAVWQRLVDLPDGGRYSLAQGLSRNLARSLADDLASLAAVKAKGFLDDDRITLDVAICDRRGERIGCGAFTPTPTAEAAPKIGPEPPSATKPNSTSRSSTSGASISGSSTSRSRVHPTSDGPRDVARASLRAPLKAER